MVFTGGIKPQWREAFDYSTNGNTGQREKAPADRSNILTRFTNMLTLAI